MKNKINFYICDDNQLFMNMVKQYIIILLEDEGRPYDITHFCSGEELIRQFSQKSANAVFLDIDMPVMTGFEIAQKLQEISREVIIIFITSHEDKVYQCWEYQPFWFIRKSHLNDLKVVLPRLLIKIDAELEKEYHIMQLHTGTKSVDIDINTVKYIQSYRHNVIIKNVDGTEMQVRCKISDVEKQLSHLYFVRVQNSIIVNCRFISKITSRYIILKSEERINISRSRLDFVKNEFQRFVRSR